MNCKHVHTLGRWRQYVRCCEGWWPKVVGTREFGAGMSTIQDIPSTCELS